MVDHLEQNEARNNAIKPEVTLMIDVSIRTLIDCELHVITGRQSQVELPVIQQTRPNRQSTDQALGWPSCKPDQDNLCRCRIGAIQLNAIESDCENAAQNVKQAINRFLKFPFCP